MFRTRPISCWVKGLVADVTRLNGSLLSLRAALGADVDDVDDIWRPHDVVVLSYLRSERVRDFHHESMRQADFLVSVRPRCCSKRRHAHGRIISSPSQLSSVGKDRLTVFFKDPQ